MPKSALTAHVFPDLATDSLLSIGQICDAGCTATFTKSDFRVECNGALLLHGERSPETRLWITSIPSTAPHETATAYANAAKLSATPAELVAFAHATLCSPVLSTLCAALDKGYISGFPGLTSKTLRKYPPQSVAMAKGHLDQTRKNQRSTQSAAAPIIEDDPNADQFPTSLDNGERTHFCYAACMPYSGQIFTDQTGRFIAPSSEGNNQLFILYDYDSNLIHAEPMRSKSGSEILGAYKRAHKMLCDAGLRPKLQRMDNECSEALQQFMTTEHIDYQFVPPGCHRRNAAERAIRTFKNHFIAALCSTDKNFPLHLWDKLLPQALISLNLMRGSRLNPKLSAWAQVNGEYKYDRTPMAPPGTRVLVHEKPADRESWAPHGVDGWYVGPALKSYRCYRAWIPDTRRERICDTLEWFPSKVTLPLASSLDLVIAAANDIVHALNNPSAGSPLAPLTDSEATALRNLAEILTNRCDNPPPSTVDQRLPAPPLRVEPPASALRVPPGFHPQQAPTTDVTVVGDTHCDPAIAGDADATFDLTSGPIGRRRRRRNSRKQLTSRNKQQPSATVTATTASPDPAAAPVPDTPQLHEHYTRSRGTFVASSACVVQAASTLQHQLCPVNTDTTGAAFKAVHPETGALVDYPALRKSSDGPAWEAAAADEIGRLAQGNHPHMPHGTDTIRFISVTDLPAGKSATYIKIVAADKPNKDIKQRVRFTVGGDRMVYDGDVSTKTANLETLKIILNSVVSTPGARFMNVDIKDFYLNTPLDEADFEYIRININDIPATIMTQYHLHDKIHKGYVYAQVRKGMYGMKQAGRIANDLLVTRLAAAGYHQETPHARLVHTRNAPSVFRAHSRRLRCQVHRQRKC